jgi:DNA-binding CsgD family transcriptional regulator
LGVIDLSKRASPENDFREFLDSVCDTHEVDYAAYAGLDPIAQTVHGFVNYPDEWQHAYVAQRFQQKDPTLLVASRSIAPVDWKHLRGEENFDTIFNAARDHGISSQGLTIPVRGPYGDIGLFSVTRNCSDREWRLLKSSIISELQTAAVHLHDKVVRSHPLGRTLSHPVLSRREIDVLQWIAAGKTQQDVGDILAISSRTVEVHLRSSRSKLGALTTAQAIGRAIGLGLIHPR